MKVTFAVTLLVQVEINPDADLDKVEDYVSTQLSHAETIEAINQWLQNDEDAVSGLLGICEIARHPIE